jgi:capsid protein
MDRHLSTLESEVAAHGKDWRKVLRQQARELKLRRELGLPDPPTGPPSKPGTIAGGDRRSGTGEQDENDNGEANADE